MISKEMIKSIAELNGIGYSEVCKGRGGCAIDKSGCIKNDVLFLTAMELFDEYYLVDDSTELLAS